MAAVDVAVPAALVMDAKSGESLAGGDGKWSKRVKAEADIKWRSGTADWVTVSLFARLLLGWLRLLLAFRLRGAHHYTQTREQRGSTARRQSKPKEEKVIRKKVHGACRWESGRVTERCH